MGDGIYITSLRDQFSVDINNCDIQGITSFPKRSRSGITTEFSKPGNNGQLFIKNTRIRHYAKCFHNESSNAYIITIANSHLSDFNCAFAFTLTPDTYVNINNTTFEWAQMDGQENGGTPLISALFEGSSTKLSFDKCIFRYTGLNNMSCVIGGAKNFTDCDFFMNNTNIGFADASDPIFDSCRFHDFGGNNYSSFTNYSDGGSTYKLVNCRFYDGGPVRDFSYPPKARISMVNCQHNKNNALLTPNYTNTWDLLFPDLDGLITENIVALPSNGTGSIAISGLTCPGPLWNCRRFLVLVIGTDASDSRKIDRQRIIDTSVRGYYKTELVYTTAGFHQIGGNTLIGGDNASEGYAISTPEGLTWRRAATGGQNVTHIKFLMIPKHYEHYF
jgi:hypothetical protein